MATVADDVVPGGYHRSSVEAPAGIRLWVREAPLVSAVVPGGVPVSVLLEDDDAWAGVDVDTLEALSDRVDDLLRAALDFALAELRRDPSAVGLHADGAAPDVAGSGADLPLGLPEAVFHADGTWMLVFTEGTFPACEPYGLGVTFAGFRPLRIEDLSEAEEVD